MGWILFGIAIFILLLWARSKKEKRDPVGTSSWSRPTTSGFYTSTTSVPYYPKKKPAKKPVKRVAKKTTTKKTTKKGKK